MLLEQANGIIDEYSRWVRENMHAVQQGDSVLIVTPMLNRNNDCMSVLLGDSPDGGYALSDLGATVADLEMSGFSLSTGKRAEKLQAILRGYGVFHTEGNELYVKASADELAPRMHMLLQAMASVDDLFQLSKDSVRELFSEDVGEWMFEHDIRCVPGPSFPGRSGLMYKFDYAIARTKRQPERLIKTINTPTENNVKNVLFGWSDLEGSREGSVGYAFLNATNGRDGKVPQSVIDACYAYGLKVVQWGIDQDMFVDELAA
ncbi:MAG: DUF1828 domain-containing protein [Atopobiaceae bacterium]|nr:DUF1828 domain-containing protein [Atopobiaceae bacterium]